MSLNTITRRQMLAITAGSMAGLAFPGLVEASSRMPSAGKYAVFVSNANDGNLTSYILNEKTSKLIPSGIVKAGKGTCSSAYWPETKTFYVANSADKTISVFTYDPKNGSLHHKNTCEIGESLVYIDLDPAGNYLVGASYFGARVVVLRLADLDTKSHAQPADTVDNIPHAHSSIFSHDGRFIYVASLLSHRLFGFKIAPNGHLTEISNVYIAPSFGTRHQYLSKDGTRLYADSEMTGQVAEFKRNTEDGTISLLRVSERPAILHDLKDGFPDAADSKQGTAGLRWTAQFHASPDEKFFFLSDRTTNTIFTLNQHLEYVSAAATERQPRGFNITPDGRFIIASGERSDHVSLYSVNQKTGRLKRVDRVKGAAGDPNWVGILPMT